MILYHGSPMAVSSPDVLHSRRRVDFGRGFYLTPLRDQAMSWSMRFKRRGSAFINKYELDDEAFQVYRVKRFDSYSEEWLDFVFSCRRGLDKTEYDIVTGGVADDKVFDTVELYLEGLISKGEAIGRLRYDKPNMQVCIRNQEVIDRHLRFVGSERL